MAESIQDTVDRLSTIITQHYTDIDTGPGSVISELLIKLAATLHNEQYNKIVELGQGASVAQVLASSEDTYSPLVDQIASNYNVSRSTGVKVLGKIKVTVSSGGDYNFRAGFVFIQPSLNFEYFLINDTRVSADPSVILGEIPLTEDNGLYYFILNVEASAAGAEYQLSSGSSFTLASNEYINGFVKAEAYGNFTSGKAPETDKELVGKIKYNLGNTRLDSPAGILNKFSSTFTGFQTLSVCGANDAEMKRSKQNMLGISTFGKADIYVRSSMGPEIKSVVKTAQKIAQDTWELTLHNTDIPGFYNITSILPVVANVNLGGTLVIQGKPNFGTVFYPGQRNNEIHSIEDSRFTKYQTASVRFTYSESPIVDVGSEAKFEVHANYQPNILEMQDLVLVDNQRLACADYLVKAVIPCMVSLNIKLLKKRSTDTFESLNLQQLKKDIFMYVNSIPFGGELHASNIIDICHNYDIKRVDLPIEMTGVILCPDIESSTITLSDNDALVIPYNVESGVTPKTTLYFIDYYRVESGVANPIDNIGLNIT